MKAIVCKKYGPPDVLRLEEVAKPASQPDQVLVQVRAASINFGDRALMRGQPFLVRLMGYGLLKPKYPILGTDIAGRVEAVADHVIDYTQQDFTQSGQHYDLIFDIVANRSVSDYMRALSLEGTYVGDIFKCCGREPPRRRMRMGQERINYHRMALPEITQPGHPGTQHQL